MRLPRLWLLTLLLPLLGAWGSPSPALATSKAPQQHAVNTINAVVGDASFQLAYSRTPDASDSEVKRVKAHLSFALSQLRKADVAHLPLAAKQMRQTAIDSLEQYIQQGVFPLRSADRLEGRRPRFIDEQGTRCAVAHLMDSTGAGELALATHQRHEYALVSDMKSPALVRWATASGFTLKELALVQPRYAPRQPASSLIDPLRNMKDAFTVECGAKYAAPTDLRVKIEIGGNGLKKKTFRKRRERGLPLTQPRHKKRVVVSAERSDLFTRCFVGLANQIEFVTGDTFGPYSYHISLKLLTAQQLLDRLFQQLDLSDTGCWPRPGPLVKQAVIKLQSGAQDFAVTVTTAPPNAEVARCLERNLESRFQHVAFGSPKINLKRYRTLKTRTTSQVVRNATKKLAPALAASCTLIGTPPTKARVRVTAKRGADQFTVRVQGTNKAAATCTEAALKRSLRRHFSVPRAAAPDYFSIDAPVWAELSFAVGAPSLTARRTRP